MATFKYIPILDFMKIDRTFKYCCECEYWEKKDTVFFKYEHISINTLLENFQNTNYNKIKLCELELYIYIFIYIYL